LLELLTQVQVVAVVAVHQQLMEAVQQEIQA
jgi:hypothetical protein